MKVYFLVVLLAYNRRNIATPLQSCRTLLRNGGWWNLVWQHYSDARLKKTLRVSKETLSYILGKIKHLLERETVTELPISTEERLATSHLPLQARNG